MKLDQTRVTETINFIANNPNFPPVRRQAVAQFCRQTFPKLSLLDFGAYNTEFHSLSGQMSVKQHATVPAGTQAERAKRRSIFLIWKSLNKVLTGGIGGAMPAAQAAMTMPTGNLDAAFSDAMLKASVSASPASAADVFQTEVVAHPRQFLAAHKVIVLGVPTGAAKFTNLLSPSFANVLTFYFQYDCGHDRFVFNGGLRAQFGAGHPFTTVSVPATGTMSRGTGANMPR